VSLVESIAVRRAEEQSNAYRWERRHERDGWDVRAKPRRCECGATLNAATHGILCRACRTRLVPTCAWDESGLRGNSRGYCHKHYMRVFRKGR
jgi:hypothetical protein